MSRTSPFISAASCAEEQILVDKSRPYTATHYKAARADVVLIVASRMGDKQVTQRLRVLCQDLRDYTRLPSPSPIGLR